MENLRYTFSCSDSGRPYCRDNASTFRVYDNACVVFDGHNIVYAGESERFTKVKHDFRKPVWGLKSFLRENKTRLQRAIEEFPTDVISGDHLLNHVYAAFYLSGFNDALVLVNDRHANDCECVALAHAREGCDPYLLECHQADEVSLSDNLNCVEKWLKKHVVVSENLCLAGSRSLNPSYNSEIVDLGLFEHYYVNPQPSEGCSEAIGAAFRIIENEGAGLQSKRLESAYLGTPYAVDAPRLPFFRLENPRQVLLQHLKAGEIIAWFQGGSEYGPRSLGHRSFFADPQGEEMVDRLSRMKGCKADEQFTLVIPDRLFHLVFETNNTDMCEFAARTVKIKRQWRDRLKSVSSCREYAQPHLLKRNVNPQLYDILMTYFEMTGVPCLLSAPLCINNFPMVETLRDLLDIVEEIAYIRKPYKVLTVFVEQNQFYEVQPENLQHETD